VYPRRSFLSIQFAETAKRFTSLTLLEQRRIHCDGVFAVTGIRLFASSIPTRRIRPDSNLRFGRIAAGPWKGIFCAQSESVRSAALIAMPDSMGAATPTRVAGYQGGLTNQFSSLSEKTDHALR
jgi:hypothetical protein